MRVFMTGATGLVGRAVVSRLRRDGHEVLAWVRAPQRAQDLLGEEARLVPASDDDRDLARHLETVDAVVHLAGAPIFGRRWTRTRKRELAASRTGLATRLVRVMGTLRRRPRVLVSASAVGAYGDRGEEHLDEESSPGHGFLAELCQGWERAAQEAELLQIRVVTVRLGVVLAREGGALASMLPAFRWGLGGRLSHGRQFMPWIHLDDAAEIFARALTDPTMVGPYNGTAPGPVTNREFTRALARALRRPALLPVPGFLLRLLVGPAASVLTGSQRVWPRRLEQRGFPFRFPTLRSALEDLLTGDPTAEVRIEELDPALELPAELSGPRPRYCLRQTLEVAAPLEEVWEFFSRPENLGAITPPSMRFRLVEPRPERMFAGQEIAYGFRLGPFPCRWRSLIPVWQERQRFVDQQIQGPYRGWWHEHRFRDLGSRTVVEDTVLYTPPMGWLGRCLHAAFIRRSLRRIFQYRASRLRLRFPLLPETPSGLPDGRPAPTAGASAGRRPVARVL